LAFPKFDKAVLVLPSHYRSKSTAGVILQLGESDWLEWSSDMDDTLELA